LDIIEDFLAKIDAANQPSTEGEKKEGEGSASTEAPGGSGTGSSGAGGSGSSGSGEGSSAGASGSGEKELTEEEKKAKEVKERVSCHVFLLELVLYSVCAVPSSVDVGRNLCSRQRL